MQLSRKQNEYIVHATHRWNIKSGAVRSGKSYVDTAFVIPSRIRERSGKPGLNVILGVSKESIERNVLQPMREIYTEELVGTINSRNVARICGEDAYCLGAEKISQVAKIQGSSIKYCYGDEVAKWNREVFQMLKSRLDKPYSCFDGSCNPEHPTHWLKEFIDDARLDIYLQRYTIFDNPFLDPRFVEELCKEYEGTIYYDRLILGLWKRAEGAIYKKYADNPEAFRCVIVDDKTKITKPGQLHAGDLSDITVGIDFGGTKSGHAFVATANTGYYDRLIGLMSRRYMAKDGQEYDSNDIDRLTLEFISEVQKKYGPVEYVYWDNAETVLGTGVKKAVGRMYPGIVVRPARKHRIKDRIDCAVRLIGAGRFFHTSDSETLSTALQDAVYNKDKLDDERLDDGSTDIDSLDAFEYTYERDMKKYLE